jgi:dethiobiotin synthetase
MQSIAIAGIHTGIGKTIVSAILAEALQADYWKPVQAGNADATDTMEVKRLVSNPSSIFYKEAYFLREAISPHAAAEKEGIQIELEKIKLPNPLRQTIVETAGGLLSPVTAVKTNLDILLQLRLPVVLVSKNYLGSINHTMLTFEVLKKSNLEIKGIIFNGPENAASENFILSNTGLTKLLSVKEEVFFDKEKVKHYAGLVPLNYFATL